MIESDIATSVCARSALSPSPSLISNQSSERYGLVALVVAGLAIRGFACSITVSVVVAVISITMERLFEARRSKPVSGSLWTTCEDLKVVGLIRECQCHQQVRGVCLEEHVLEGQLTPECRTSSSRPVTSSLCIRQMWFTRTKT